MIAAADRWNRIFSDSALVGVFRDSLLYRLVAERVEFLALCLITLLAPFIPVTGTAVLIVATGLLFLARKRWQGVTGLPLFKQVLVFWAVLLLLSVFSVVRRSSLEQTLLYGVYFSFYFMCLLEIKDERKLYVLCAVFLATVVLEAGLGLYQNFISHPPIDPSWVDSIEFPEITVRVFGTLDNPNILAQFLIPGVVLGLALALQRARISVRMLFLGGVALAGACLVYTYSRMGWVAAAVAVAVFLLLYDRRLLLAVAALVVLAVTFRPDLLSSRLTSILALSQDSSMFYRLQIWQVAGHIIRDFWFSGVGPGVAAFQLVYNRYYSVYGMTAFHTHNLYLEMLVEYGVFGTLIFLWLLLSYFGYSLQRLFGWLGASLASLGRSSSASGFARIATMAALASMTGYLFMGLTEYSWYSLKLVFLFWLLVSLTICSARLLEERPEAAAAVAAADRALTAAGAVGGCPPGARPPGYPLLRVGAPGARADR